MNDKRGLKRKRADRDGGDSFVLIPNVVLNSKAYLSLSAHAKVLLIDIAQQYKGYNNGKLLCTPKYLSKRGWNSSDMLTKAKRQLIKAKLIHETVLGSRPNRASWYAITWVSLDKLPGYDAGAEALFPRGGYNEASVTKIEAVIPKRGATRPTVVPPSGVDSPATTPHNGAVSSQRRKLLIPQGGNHLEEPSARRRVRFK